ncbi:MAG: hypothetical protein MUF54_17940 [Polyangiaceae bacterium]|jgi:hypothetical protein|nr:hypothetical protein [Polyangiaceae bacterium]
MGLAGIPAGCLVPKSAARGDYIVSAGVRAARLRGRRVYWAPDANVHFNASVSLAGLVADLIPRALRRAIARHCSLW